MLALLKKNKTQETLTCKGSERKKTLKKMMKNKIILIKIKHGRRLG